MNYNDRRRREEERRDRNAELAEYGAKRCSSFWKIKILLFVIYSFVSSRFLRLFRKNNIRMASITPSTIPPSSQIGIPTTVPPA